MADQQRFAARLRELREKAGLSRRELAEKSEVSERAIVQWERSEREPSWSNVLAIAKALGVSCEAFQLAGEEPALEAPPTKPGRPRKAPAATEEPETPAASKAKGGKGKGRKKT